MSTVPSPPLQNQLDAVTDPTKLQQDLVRQESVLQEQRPVVKFNPLPVDPLVEAIKKRRNT